MQRIALGTVLCPQNGFAIKFCLISLIFNFLGFLAIAHPITGVWRGQVQSGKGAKKITSTIEVKLVDDGKNIVGTVYYLGSGKNYIRYSLKGNFWGSGNSIFWQDHSIVNMKVNKPKKVNDFKVTMKYFANYSNRDGINGKLLGYCMLADMPHMNFELKKMEESLFPDEWDAVIADHYSGRDVSAALDSVWAISSEPMVSAETGVFKASQVKREPEMNQLNSESPALENLEMVFPERFKPTKLKNPKEPDTKPLMENESEMVLTIQGSNKGLKSAG